MSDRGPSIERAKLCMREHFRAVVFLSFTRMAPRGIEYYKIAMQVVSQIGGSVTNSLAYIGSLASLGGRAAYYTLVARPFSGGRQLAASNARRPWTWACGPCRFCR